MTETIRKKFKFECMMKSDSLSAKHKDNSNLFKNASHPNFDVDQTKEFIKDDSSDCYSMKSTFS